MAAATDPPASPYQRAQHTATTAGDWVAQHWASWVGSTLQIALIVVGALVLRALVRRTITRLIDRMNRAQAHSALALGGLLVNAERRRQRSEAIGSVLRSVASFVILGTAALMVLTVLKIDLAPLLASAGVAGVAVGFGARNLVTDFLSGVFMILEDQYGVGDVIDAGVASGTVVEVGLRVTKLRGEGGEIWYVRNGEVQRIGNLSQGWALATLDVQVGYGQDLDRARALIAESAEAMAKEEPWDEALWEPVRVLGLESVGEGSVVLRVQAKTVPGRAADVARELRWRVKKAFDESGIALVGGAPATTVRDAAAAADPAAPAASVAPAGPAAAAGPSAAEGPSGIPSARGGAPGRSATGSAAGQERGTEHPGH
jgi:small conductance mechanosensitive channel